jgi:hypothetical protein
MSRPDPIAVSRRARPGWALMAGLALASAAQAAPPAVNLRIELRWRQEPVAAAPPGTVIVRSDGSGVDPHGPGQVWRTDPAEEDDLAPGGRLPMLTVRNGAAVRVALTQWRPQSDTEWRWRSDVTTPAAAAASGAQSPGQVVLRGQDRWQADTASLTLQPAWPGGRQPVSLRYDLSLPQAGGTAPTEGPSPRMEGAGELLLPLNQWTPLGQWAPAPSAAGRGGVSYSTRDARPASEGGIRWLEVRVTRP